LLPRDLRDQSALHVGQLGQVVRVAGLGGVDSLGVGDLEGDVGGEDGEEEGEAASGEVGFYCEVYRRERGGCCSAGSWRGCGGWWVEMDGRVRLLW